MRVIALTAVGLAISVIPGLASTHTQVFESPPGGSLWFRVRGGDLHITRGTDLQHIVVRYTPDPKKPEQEKRSKSGRGCTVRRSRLRSRRPCR